MVHKNNRGRPRKDDESRSADRQALVAATLAIVREGGAAAFSARSVAERAGVALGSVYTQFDSLEALRLEANAVTMRLLRNTLASALAAHSQGSTEDRLLCLADAYIAFADKHHNAWAALFESRTIEPPAEIAADISALFSVLEEVLRDSGCLREREIPVMAKALWSSVHGMVYLGNLGALGPVGPQDVRPMIEALIRTVVRGLSHSN
jgi:AcrR family transcriptional regulator